MLRRFENFKVGALDARRLNEMVDVIIDLQRKVDRIPKFDYSQYGSFLARITERVDTYEAQGEGNTLQPLDIALYKFEEIAIRAVYAGSSSFGTSYIGFYRHADGMLSSASMAQQYGDRSAEPLLVDVGVSEYRYKVGDIVPCFKARIDTTAFGSTDDAQYIYVISSSSPSETVGVYDVLASMPNGMYSVRSIDDSTGEPEIMENLYETSDYYGALLGTQNPCATLTPRRLGQPDRVFGFTQRGKLYTCSPTAWGVECQPCGTNPGGALASTYDAAGNEASVAGMMLKGL